MKDKWTRCTFAGAIALVVVGLANAAGLPHYDVDHYCTNVSSGSSATKNTCIALEQRGYDSLQKVWKDAPPKAQDYCKKIAQSGEGGSYATLNSCINIESRAAAHPKKFKY